MSDIHLPSILLSNDQKESSFFSKCSLLPVEGSTSAANSCKSKSATSSPQTTKKKCTQCSKRLNLTNMFVCKCEGLFCSAHKYPDVHGCSFDYKTEWKKSLEKKNSGIGVSKLEKL